MAFYIEIVKVSEADDAVKYSYLGDGKNIGYLSIGKSDGIVTLLVAAVGDGRENYCQRAAEKLRRERAAG